MKYYINIFAGLLVALITISCDDEFEGEIVRDNLASIPVTFEGATTAGFNPYYAVSYNGGSSAVTITLRIPEDSPLRIKQVANIVAGSTAINVASLANAKQFLSGPVTVDGYSYTLTTSLEEINVKAIGSGVVPPAIKLFDGVPAAGATFEEGAFMVRLIMEDDSEIIPVQVRLRVIP